ncbi:hypothetical protein [Vibrio ziniensis]|uniref:Lipoprotein n=1 Tax=Vibrio ziniensis TaxID=2711221 RepID=A0A6G7CJE9_9VIBR|nr:hypothetical protein [Vibrio ziniensis]QIH42173.1 hypothetical protein G5S32_09270 [Vibrio ziniensis]
MKAIKYTVSILLAVLLVGCGRVQPVMNVENTPVAYNLQSEQVKAAIITAATNRGWIISNNTSTELGFKLLSRDHSAEISIPYSAKYYSINYVTSTNLLASDGTIHRNYNRWINNLNVDIQKYLARASVK